MEIKQRLFLFCLCCFSSPSWSDIQYKPLSSAERHELSSGFSTKDWQKKLLKNLPAVFLKYTFYFPETEDLLPESYKKIFIPGLSTGAFLRAWDKGKNYGICKVNAGIHSVAYHLGLKGKSSYFEFLQPFGEFGLARSFCYAKNSSKNPKANLKLSHYFSYGFSLSLKILDKTSIYVLDQDYGINDIGIKTECLHYYTKDKTNKIFSFCQLGLQISF